MHIKEIIEVTVNNYANVSRASPCQICPELSTVLTHFKGIVQIHKKREQSVWLSSTGRMKESQRFTRLKLFFIFNSQILSSSMHLCDLNRCSWKLRITKCAREKKKWSESDISVSVGETASLLVS